MNIVLQKNSPLGLRVQVKIQIRFLIESGALDPGQALPSARDLSALLQINRNTITSDYMAVTLPDECIGCGECVDRCVFGARAIKGERLEFNSDACLGCGLCVTVCPGGAISMALWPFF